MALTRWDPWRELATLERQFDDLFGRLGRSSGGRESKAWTPALDVHEEGDTMVVRAEIAGVAPEDVEITVENDVLTISGSREEDRTVEEGKWIRRERQTGRFQRAISLPPGVDPAQIKADAKNGVVEVRVPRPRTSEPHRVQLQGSGGGSSSSVPVSEGSSEAATDGGQQSNGNGAENAT